VLVAALVLVALCAVGLELLVRDGVITTVSEGRFVRYRNDDYGHLAYRMVKLKQEPPTGEIVYLLGGSATMECFLSEPSLGADVSAAAGGPVRVISLAGHQQSFAESLALVENLPRGHGLVAVGLAPMRFSNAPQDDAGLLVGEPFMLPVPLVRAALAAQHVKLPPVDMTAPGLVRYGVGYVKERRRIGEPLFADIGYSMHYTIDGPLQSRAEKLAMARRDVAQDTATYGPNAAYNFALLADLVRAARSRGFRVAFFDQPLNVHVIGATWNGVVPSYRRRALALAARLGVPYLDVGQRVKLDDQDFLDVYHLVVRGRLKWQPVFSRELARALRGEAQTAGP
jgi:hypothetical protein